VPADDEFHIDPNDPLGVDPLLAARRDWDAQEEAARRRWDELTPAMARLEENHPADLTGADVGSDHSGPWFHAGAPADTAGEEDHSDPWAFAGEPADPPADTGRPPDEAH
jgi:hypothetical protein